MAAGYCISCAQPVDGWLPFPIRASENSDFLRRAVVVGSNVDRFKCPHCGSIDRERHLQLFLEQLGWLAELRGADILHVAPELRLGPWIASHGPRRLVRGDLVPADPSIERIDLEQLAFADQTFDLVIANHVLEHVADYRAALGEIQRVLRPGGRLICQTPYAARLARTFEEPLLQSGDDRLFLYAQADHLRLFGLDLAEIIRSCGLSGRLVPHAEILPELDAEYWGVNEHEPFFDFVRPTS